MMAGYDDSSITNAVDLVMAEAERQGVTRVFWLTYPHQHRIRVAGRTARQKPLRQSQQRVGCGGAATSFASHPRLGRSHDESTVLVRERRHPSQPSRVLSALRRTSRTRWTPNRRSADAARSTPSPAPSAVERHPPRCPRTLPASSRSTPKRVLDTRDADLGGAAGMLGGGRTVSIDVSSARAGGC